MAKMISESFVYDLKEGCLCKILKYVKADSTLQFEIRKNYINIYYRGGSLIKIKEISENLYNAYFDKNYITSNDSEGVIIQCIEDIDSIEKTRKLIEFIPKIKQQMDFWMKLKKPDGGEREYKHIVAKENNSGNVGKYSDYFICDIEYTGHLNKEEDYKFDMIGVKWPANSKSRENNDSLSLCIIGMKHNEYEDFNITNYSSKIYEFIICEEKLNRLKEDIKEIYNIKSQLGLIYPYNNVNIDFGSNIEILFIFANQNPKHSKLNKDMEKFRKTTVYKNLGNIAEIKIAKGSFMGYRLYDESLMKI